MSHIRSRTTKIFDSEVLTAVSTKTFNMSDNRGASIQVGITEITASASVFLDECVCLTCDTITETTHGYVTGLKGTVSAQIGCPSTFPFNAILSCFNIILDPFHSFTTGERGRFTTTCTLPTFCGCVICSCTDYYITVVTTCLYRIATTRARSISGNNEHVMICSGGFGCQTLTPNGAIPTGLSTCVDSSFIIKVDDCTYQIASSHSNANAGTPLDITALQSPASTTFTPTATDCDNGSVTVRYSNGSCTFVADTSGGLLNTPLTIGACGLSVLDNSANICYSCIEVEVDIDTSQWIVNIIMNGKG